MWTKKRTTPEGGTPRRANFPPLININKGNVNYNTDKSIVYQYLLLKKYKEFVIIDI